MKKYMLYLDNGFDPTDPRTSDTIRIAIPEDSKKKALKRYTGGRAVITVADVSNQYPISGNRVRHALETDGFDKIEIDYISRCLDYCNITSPEVNT